jgi:cardiolipin synthase
VSLDGWTGLGVALAGHVLGLAAALHALLHKKRHPSGALVWVLFCATVPFLGAALYLTVGYDRITKRRRRNVRAAHRSYFAPGREGVAAELRGSGVPEAAAKPPGCSLRPLSPFPARAGNRVAVLVGGEATYAAMLEAIAHAQRSIYLQIFIFDDDDDGRRFAAELAERARSGVRVRVLYDAVGTSKRGARLLRSVETGEGRIASFLPFHPLKRRFQINLRNHRKILVADDERAFLGSHNISTRHRRLGPEGSRDFMLGVHGPLVEDLFDVFASDWMFAAGERLRFRGPDARGAGEDVLQLFESGPDDVDGGVKHAMLAAIYAARSDILVLTPYFVPPPELLTALQCAAARKVRVRLLIPGRCSHRVIHWATRSFLTPLYKSGVEIAERPDAFLHMKLLVVDEDFVIGGSTNLDYRSFHLNFEADVVVYGGELQHRLRAVAEAEWSAATPFPAASLERPRLKERFLYRAAALWSPVL